MANATAEIGSQVLHVLGAIASVNGALTEANATWDLEMHNNRGYVNAGLMWAGTAAIGVEAGVVDDALGAATIGIGSAPVVESYETVGSGPTQHAVGEAIRATLDWGARNGY